MDLTDWGSYELGLNTFVSKWFNVVRPECKKTKFIDLYDASKRIDGFANTFDMLDVTHSDQYKEELFNNKLNRFHTMGKLKKFYKYRNRFINGRLVREQRPVDLSKQKLSRIIKRERNKPYSYYSALPLPVNEVSTIVGCMKGKVHTPNYKLDYDSDFSIKEILCRNNEHFNEFMKDKSGIVLPGAWRYSSINLVDMCTPHSHSFTISEMISGLKSRRNLEFILPKIDNYKRDSILGLSVNGKANPGVNTTKLLGHKRLKSVGLTKTCAYDLAGEMLRGTLVVDKSLVHIGGREKRNLYPSFSGVKNAKARITCGQEDVPTLIGQSLIVPLNKSLQMLNKGFNWGGRINGRRNFKQLVDMLDDKDSEDMINCNTDFNGHDNWVSEDKIVLAFAVLRSCFPRDRGIDNLFFYCLSSMVFKRMVLPESGLIYEVTKGVLTGHAFTSVITTLCAYITLATSIKNSCNKKLINKTRLQGAGDDWIMKLPKDRLNFIHSNILKSGNSCDEMTTTSGNLKDTYPNEFPTFLKKQYLYGFIGWNVPELFTNFVYPRSTKLKLLTRIENYIVMCVSGPFNRDINYCCKKLIIYNIIDMYCRGRHGYCSNNVLYKDIFSVVYRALLEERDIDKILTLIPTSMNFSFMGDISGFTESIDVQSLTRSYINKLDLRVRKSQYWMLRPTFFNRHEVVRRLKVFDLNKTYVEPMLFCKERTFTKHLYAYVREHGVVPC